MCHIQNGLLPALEERTNLFLRKFTNIRLWSDKISCCRRSWYNTFHEMAIKIAVLNKKKKEGLLWWIHRSWLVYPSVSIEALLSVQISVKCQNGEISCILYTGFNSLTVSLMFSSKICFHSILYSGFIFTLPLIVIVF